MNTEQKTVKDELSEVLRAGMVIVPKPEHFERLSKCLIKTRYIVTEYDVNSGGEVGELWMIEK